MPFDRATSQKSGSSVPAHERRKVYALVQEVRHLQLYLQHHHYPDAQTRRQRSAVLNGLSWALDRLGYPPTRYEEVVREYAPAGIKERRKVQRAKRPKPEPAESASDSVSASPVVPEKGWIR